MFESKYSKVLTVILVIVIIAIVGLLGIIGYDFYQKYFIEKETSDFVEDFKGEVEDNSPDDTTGEQVANNDNNSTFGDIKETKTAVGKTKKTYKGFGVLGTMEIPTTKFSYPVLEKVTTKSLDTAVAYLYGTGLNQEGNTVIIGHNYRNGLFFSNNNKINNGDKIYVTDNEGKRVEYTVYNKFQTTPEDTSFYQRDTNGKAELTLSTCSDDGKSRIIICARAE